MNPGITEAEIYAAADRLFLSGQQPTMRAVHEAVGTSASMGTVQKYMRLWWSQAGPRLRGQLDGALPDRERQVLDQLWMNLKASADEDARLALQPEKDAIEAARAELQEREAEMDRRAETDAARIAELEEANRQLVKAAEGHQAAFRQETEALRKDRAQIMSRLDDAQTVIQSLEHKLAQTEERREMNEKHWLSQLATERDRVRNQEKLDAKRTQEMLDLRKEVTEASMAAREAGQRAQAAEAERDRLWQELQRVNNESSRRGRLQPRRRRGRVR